MFGGMFGWTTSELLFYCGIGIMILAAIAGAVSVIVFRVTGKRIKKNLEREYGRPHR